MNEHILFVVFPMIGLALIPLAAPWIQRFSTQFRIWIIVRIIEDTAKDIKVSMEELRIREKEMIELKKQADAELILRDTPTSEQAKVTQDNKERFRVRLLVIQQKFAALRRDFYSIHVTLGDQTDRLQAFEEELHQYRDE
ncbi:hypothetical protein PEX1_090160 [Penicillium expansum]|uniref:Uncharacterized protein n=1 Tax=Penicillium expansum TaxID=27334 RepID=A0A0A2IL78_PENEN|nr:hypothetical protein PEX2_092730 [Penicillium expansum]KGO41015.1 hypothetical protein PEXP_083780 [Penicillium expansum]KGO58918.1 hypothetical protein PEX2_092730 [Penicillium expansum]KGO65401.1 hypothetical protein PEX1_090160 [Penicillium expansum]